MVQDTGAARQNNPCLYLDVMADPAKVFDMGAVFYLTNHSSAAWLTLSINNDWYYWSTLMHRKSHSLAWQKYICYEQVKLVTSPWLLTRGCGEHWVLLLKSMRYPMTSIFALQICAENYTRGDLAPHTFDSWQGRPTKSHWLPGKVDEST